MPIATYEEFAIGTKQINTQYLPLDPDEAEWSEPESRADGEGNPVIDGYARVVWRWPRADECLVSFMKDYYDPASPNVYIYTRHRDAGRPVLASAKFFSWRARRITPVFWEATATFIKVQQV